MKICCTCKLHLEDDKFSFKIAKDGIRSSKCKDCTKLYGKKHYNNNKNDYIQRSKNNIKNERKKTKDLISKLKIKCVECGESHPGVLDFHHIDKNQKDKNVSQITSRKKIIEESKKCIILCSNCHRKLHWEERNNSL
jgi:hypothetical protein